MFINKLLYTKEKKKRQSAKPVRELKAIPRGKKERKKNAVS